MARPPVDWPIPVYTAELRERVVVVCTVPSRCLAGRVSAPVLPRTAHGTATVALAVGSGRCLKSACGSRQLSGEFRVWELLTPVRWTPPCRSAVQGNWLLGLACDSPGLRRLLRTTLSTPVAAIEGGTDPRWESCIRVERPVREALWREDSAFESPEGSEGLLLHPECYFVPDASGEMVRATPVHQYSRATVHVATEECTVPAVARLLDLREEDVGVDHVLHQRRCTHTWAFPAERITLVARPVARMAA